VIRVIQGQGRESDRSGDLAQSIMDLIDEKAEGMPVSHIMGCLECVKQQIWMEATEE
jgi:hypothetical protein